MQNCFGLLWDCVCWLKQQATLQDQEHLCYFSAPLFVFPIICSHNNRDKCDFDKARVNSPKYTSVHNRDARNIHFHPEMTVSVWPFGSSKQSIRAQLQSSSPYRETTRIFFNFPIPRLFPLLLCTQQLAASSLCSSSAFLFINQTQFLPSRGRGCHGKSWCCNMLPLRPFISWHAFFGEMKTCLDGEKFCEWVSCWRQLWFLRLKKGASPQKVEKMKTTKPRAGLSFSAPGESMILSPCLWFQKQHNSWW